MIEQYLPQTNESATVVKSKGVSICGKPTEVGYYTDAPNSQLLLSRLA